jgi:Cd2+/Zn2+-exporting ATPase
MKKVYSIEGIDCANCAAKVEDKINKIKGIDEAVLNFMTSKLSIEFKSSEEKDVEQVMNEVKKIIAKMEPDAKLS